MHIKSSISEISRSQPQSSEAFNAADEKYLLETWLKLIFDFSEECLRLLEVQNPENCETNSL